MKRWRLYSSGSMTPMAALCHLPRSSGIVLSLAVVLLHADPVFPEDQLAQADQQLLKLYTNSRYHYQLRYIGTIGRRLFKHDFSRPYLYRDRSKSRANPRLCGRIIYSAGRCQLTYLRSGRPTFISSTPKNFHARIILHYARVTSSEITVAKKRFLVPGRQFPRAV